MSADQVGSAVLTLSTDSATVYADLEKIKQGVKDVAGTVKATSDASSSDWATMAKAITAVSTQLAEQKARAAEAHQAHVEVGEGLKTVRDLAKEVAGALGLAFTVGAGIEFVAKVAEEAEALKHLSEQTQINLQDLQTLRAATAEYGVDADELGRALFQLKQKIAGGDQSVANAYHLMGLSLDEIKGKDPVDLFVTTERALGDLHGSLRDVAAADLFGGRLGSSLLALSTGIDEAMEKARGQKRATDESIISLAEFNSQIERSKKTLSTYATEVLGPVAQGFNTVTDAAGKAGVMAAFWAMMKDGVGNSGPLAAWLLGTDNLTTLLDHLNQKTAENTKNTGANADAHRTAAEALDDEALAARYMAGLATDSLKPLLDWQEKYLIQLDETNQADAQHIAGLHITVDQLARWKANQHALIESTTLLATQYKAFDAQLAHMDEQTFQIHLESLKKVREERERNLTIANANALAELAALAKLNEAYGLDVQGHIKIADAAETLRLKLLELTTARNMGLDVSKQEAVAEKEYTDALYKEAEAMTIVGHGADDIEAGFGHAAKGAAQFRGEMVLVSENLDDLNKKLKAFYDSLTGGAGVGIPSGTAAGSVGIPSGGLGLPRMPGRVGGGPVSAGVPYVVGERRAEIFVPDQNGSIVPSVGGGGNIHVHVYGDVNDANRFQRKVKQGVEDGLRDKGRRI
jgi:hypothetical protein